MLAPPLMRWGGASIGDNMVYSLSEAHRPQTMCHKSAMWNNTLCSSHAFCENFLFSEEKYEKIDNSGASRIYLFKARRKCAKITAPLSYTIIAPHRSLSVSLIVRRFRVSAPQSCRKGQAPENNTKRALCERGKKILRCLVAKIGFAFIERNFDACR